MARYPRLSPPQHRTRFRSRFKLGRRYWARRPRHITSRIMSFGHRPLLGRQCMLHRPLMGRRCMPHRCILGRRYMARSSSLHLFHILTIYRHHFHPVMSGPSLHHRQSIIHVGLVGRLVHRRILFWWRIFFTTFFRSRTARTALPLSLGKLEGCAVCIIV